MKSKFVTKIKKASHTERDFFGASGGTRTPSLGLRRPAFYPDKLQTQKYVSVRYMYVYYYNYKSSRCQYVNSHIKLYYCNNTYNKCNNIKMKNKLE